MKKVCLEFIEKEYALKLKSRDKILFEKLSGKSCYEVITKGTTKDKLKLFMTILINNNQSITTLEILDIEKSAYSNTDEVEKALNELLNLSFYGSKVVR